MRNLRIRAEPALSIDCSTRATGQHHGLALPVGGKRANTQLTYQIGNRSLTRPDPLAARFREVAFAEVVVESPSADAVARFQHHEGLAPRTLQVTCRGQACQPGTDDGHLKYVPLIARSRCRARHLRQCRRRRRCCHRCGHAEKAAPRERSRLRRLIAFLCNIVHLASRLA